MYYYKNETSGVFCSSCLFIFFTHLLAANLFDIENKTELAKKQQNKQVK